MRPTLVVLALWAGYITLVHVLGGARRVVTPLREAAVEPFARGTLLVVWHMVTWALVTLTAAIAVAAVDSRFENLVMFAGLQATGFSAVFVITSRRELGAAIRLPQWLLLGPLAFGLLATITDRSAALAAGALVGLIGLGHLAWALGVPWPARDRAQLSAHMLPRAGASRLPSRLPSRAITLVVTAVLFAMSACLVAPDLVAHVVPGVRWLVVAIAAVFALRGIGGLAYWTRRRESGPDAAPSPFFVYNRVLYSPGCLLIAALAATSSASMP